MKHEKALIIQEQDKHFEFVQKELFEYWSDKIETNDYTFEHGFGIPEPDDSANPADLAGSVSAPDSGFIRLLNACNNGIALIGGAGTGKTHILAHLALFLARKKIFVPEEILVITGTPAESGRIASMIIEQGSTNAAGSAGGIRIKGINEFCLKLLSEAYESAPRVFDDDDRIHFLSLIFPFLGEENLLRLSALIRDEQVSDAENRNREENEDLVNLRDTYMDSLASIKACDSWLVPLQALKALHDRPQVCFQFRQKYRFIIIDDIQHLNENELNLVSFLLKQGNILETDSDLEQKIAVSIDPVEQNRAVYGNFLCQMFLSDFVSKRFFLKKSYRVPGRILSGIRMLFSREKLRKKHVPKSIKGQGYYSSIYRATGSDTEADFIASTIRTITDKSNKDSSGPYTPADIGICMRNRLYSGEICNALDKLEIPYTEDIEPPFTGMHPYHQIISFFRFLVSEKDLTAFTDILLHLSCNFTIHDIRNIFISGNRLDESLAQLLLRLYNNRMLSDRQYQDIQAIFETRNRLKAIVSDTGIAEGIAYLLNTYGLSAGGNNTNSRNAGTDQPFYMNQFSEFARFCKNDTLRFLSGLFSLPQKINGITNNSVSVFTFNRARGRVFQVLFIPCMEEGICPGYHGTPDMQTESGLLYTAVTRSSKLVYFSYAAERAGAQRRVSSFILNMKSKIREINPATESSPSHEFSQGNLFHN